MRGGRGAAARGLQLRVMLLVVLLVGASAGCARAAAESGVLVLRVYRPGVVWLDDARIRDLSGRTERAPRAWDLVVAQSAEFSPGRYRLRLEAADDMTLAPLDEVEFTLAAGETANVALGRPLLLSSPTGARVRVGERDVGVTPLRLDPERLGSAAVALTRDGYATWQTTGDSLLARAREAGALRVELVPGGVAPPPGARPAPRHYLGLRRTPALITSGLLVAAGVTSAILLKQVADDRFESYGRTGDPALQRRFFSDAERYDRLSLVGWGVAEAAFFASFFLIIQEEPRGFIPTVTAARAPDGSPGVRVGVTHGF